jgi:hypothetical protein
MPDALNRRLIQLFDRPFPKNTIPLVAVTVKFIICAPQRKFAQIEIGAPSPRAPEATRRCVNRLFLLYFIHWPRKRRRGRTWVAIASPCVNAPHRYGNTKRRSPEADRARAGDPDRRPRALNST